ncbi:MAG: aldolase [Burkholderiales bacterium]|nr:MAG: aldolase [Burkholderiales bacterium]
MSARALSPGAPQMPPDDPIARGRVDLACALRQAARMGLAEGVCNHFSFALPGLDDRFLINPQGLHWSEIRAADVLLIDGAGHVLDGPHTVEPTAFFIHARIHRANPRARCVLHTHMPFATALTLLREPQLLPASQTALKFHGRIACDPVYNGLVLDDAEGDRIVAALGDADVLFMANHGVIVAAPSVAWAFDDLYYLERACMLQVLAEGTGRKLRLIDRKVAEHTARQMDAERQQSDLHFAALARELDRLDPMWRRLDAPNPSPVPVARRKARG